MENEILKHLEFLQNTINRMSTNSFIIKGWAIALVGIILGFNKLKGNYLFQSCYNFPIEMVIILLLIFLFWFTNAYFLQQERRFIYIYTKTIKTYRGLNNNGREMNNHGGEMNNHGGEMNNHGGEMNNTLSMNYADYVPNNSKYKIIISILLSIVFFVSAILAFLNIDFFVLKALITVLSFLAFLFTITYIIPQKYFCQYWTCIIARTIVSVYGTMIVLLLLINHAIFNMP